MGGQSRKLGMARREVATSARYPSESPIRLLKRGVDKSRSHGREMLHRINMKSITLRNNFAMERVFRGRMKHTWRLRAREAKQMVGRGKSYSSKILVAMQAGTLRPIKLPRRPSNIINRRRAETWASISPALRSRHAGNSWRSTL